MVDSDGCVFDSMPAKHRLCFLPALLQIWGLDAFSEIVTNEALRLNLNSPYRGENRFIILLRLLRTFQEDPRLADARCDTWDLTALEEWVHSGQSLCGTSLEAEYARNRASILEQTLRWHHLANQKIAFLPPPSAFSEAIAALPAARTVGEVRVVSSANFCALEREWAAAGLLQHVSALHGQEDGSKEAILRNASREFSAGRLVMIGDSPGDLSAAEAAGVSFFPIRSGSEEADWNFFRMHFLPWLHDGDVIRDILTTRTASWLASMGIVPQHSPA